MWLRSWHATGSRTLTVLLRNTGMSTVRCRPSRPVMQRDKGFDPAIADFAIVDRAHAPQISVARNPGERSVANGHAKTSHGASWEKVMGRARSLAASLVILAVLLLPACSSSVKVGPE